MKLLMNTINWLNAEPTETTVLQRDGVFALLTWKDLTQQAEPLTLTFRAAMTIFIVVVAVPLIVMS